MRSPTVKQIRSMSGASYGKILATIDYNRSKHASVDTHGALRAMNALDAERRAIEYVQANKRG